MSLPLTALFVDCDSYFASAEQHLNPALLGLPVAVAPVMVESSCCIAASYPAKAMGVKTGTVIHEARRLCPGIIIVEARPSEYIRLHHRVVAAVESCIHVEAVLSIDEMWAWLPYNWREPAYVEDLGRRIKATIAQEIGPAIKVSIGAAPNRFLAKMASKMRKPDGLFLIESDSLPEVLHELDLTDLHGVGRSMEIRFHAAGIHSVADLCAAPKEQLRRAWSGVLGDRYWHLLRGEEVPDLPTVRRSLGHSHVLAPNLRTPDKAWPVVCKLLHKACERLRAMGYLSGALTLQVGYQNSGSHEPELRHPETDSTLALLHVLKGLWSELPKRGIPVKVGVVLSRFTPVTHHTPDLFQEESALGVSHEDEIKHRRLDAAVDRLRDRYGRDVVTFGAAGEACGTAPMRISFNHIPDIGLEGDRKDE